jgi:hypothetical protein
LQLARHGPQSHSLKKGESDGKEGQEEGQEGKEGQGQEKEGQEEGQIALSPVN